MGKASFRFSALPLLEALYSPHCSSLSSPLPLACLPPLPCPVLPWLALQQPTQPSSPSPSTQDSTTAANRNHTLTHTTHRTAPHLLAATHQLSRTGLADCSEATSSFDAASIPKHHPPKPYHPALPAHVPGLRSDTGPVHQARSSPAHRLRYTHTPIISHPSSHLLGLGWAPCRVVLSLVLTARGKLETWESFDLRPRRFRSAFPKLRFLGHPGPILTGN